CAIGRARRSYRHSIGHHRNGLVRDEKGVLAFQGKRRDSIAILRTVQLKQNPVEPIEEGCLEDTSGGYVLAGEWQRSSYYLVLMKSRVVIHPVGICFQNLPHICWQVALIFGVDRFPYSQEVDEVVGHRRLPAFGRGKLATGRKRHLLQRDKVVLGLGETQPASYICVPGADHMRHAKGIALDSNVILAGPLN